VIYFRVVRCSRKLAGEGESEGEGGGELKMGGPELRFYECPRTKSLRDEKIQKGRIR